MLMQSAPPLRELENHDEFIPRHIGISQADERHMLSVIGEASRRALVEGIVRYRRIEDRDFRFGTHARSSFDSTVASALSR